MSLQLEYGVRQKVFVTHIEDDGTFFVQLETDVAYGLSDLSHNIQTVIETHGRTPLVPEYGLKCYAFSIRDQTWYRALISEVDSLKVTVYYVDYGNTEPIPLENLNSPTDSLFDSPYQAVCCTFSDFIPFKAGRELKQALSSKLLEKEFNGNFVSRSSQKHPYLSFLPCNNLTLFRDGDTQESLAQLLITEGLGQFCICADDIKIGSRHKVYTCFHDSPGKFWVQLSSRCDLLQTIMGDLNEPNTVGRLKPLPSEAFSPGVACCCQFTEDNQYYRVEVIEKTKGPSKYRISFVDYGNCEVVEQSDIMELPSRLALHPYCAIQCCLDGVTPVKREKPDPKLGSIAWSQQACDKFASTTQDRELSAHFVSEFTPEIFNVKLTDIESNTEIAHSLAESGHAKLSEEVGATPALPNEYQYVNLDMGKTYKDVLITYAESPSVVWCQLPDQFDDFNALTVNISEHGPDLPPCRSIDVNEPCCVKYAVDDSWCRGSVSSVDSGQGTAQVFYVDFGNTETVNISDIKEPLSEFFSLPAQAVSFSLAETSPRDGSTWNQDAIGAFQDLTVNKSFTCRVVGLDDDGYPSAKLVDHQNKDIGLEFIRQGHAKAPLGLAANKLSHPPVTQEKPPVQNFNSHLGGGGASQTHSRTSSKGSNQSPFQSQKASPAHSFSSGEGKTWSKQRHPSNRSDKDGSNRSRSYQKGSPKGSLSSRSSLQGSRDQSPSTYRSSRYRRVRLQTGESYEVCVCHVESLNEFYCQLHKNGARLQDLMQNIERHCNSSNARLVSHPSPDVPVLAKFSGDGAWNRAIVKQTPNEKGCRVIFVDYGNSETVPPNSLIEIPSSFIGLETQAIQCALIGVPRSFSPPESTVDTFSEMTVDKDFTFSVKKFIRDKELNVGELLCQDGSSLLDQLVKKGLVPAPSPRSSTSRESNRGHGGKGASPQSPKRSRQTQNTGVPLPRIPVNESVDVISSFTGSPSLFYLQLSNSYVGLEQLTTAVNEFYSKIFDYEHKLSRPAVGDFCAAKFSEDSLWYRARVSRLSQGGVEVVFIDYGNSETVSTANLKVLQSQFTSQPSFAIPCNLAGLSTSSEAAAQKFVERVTDCQLVAQFQQPLSSYDGPVSVKLFDTSVPDKDVNIANDLSAPSAAKSSQTQSDVQIAPVTPVMNSPMECSVSFVVSPRDFYCQLTSEAEPFDRLMNKLYAYYGEQEEGASLRSPVVGTYCAAPYSSDGSWYRGRLKDVTSKGVSVHYIDYGNTDQVEVEKLRELDPEFLGMPAQALKCQLSSLTPVSGQWSGESAAMFHELVMEKAEAVQVIFVSQLTRGCFEVQVSVKGEDVAQRIVEAGHARKQMSGKAAAPSAQNLTISPHPATKDSQYGVIVTFVESPHEFFCQVQDLEEKLDALMTEIDHHCRDSASVSPAHFSWKSADYALAQFSEDKMWYRARITKVLRSGAAFDVHYIDYGNNEVVSASQLRPLKPEFCRLPCQALKCRLNGSEFYTCTKERQDKFGDLILNVEFEIKCASVSSEGTCAVDMKRKDDFVDVMSLVIDKILIPRSQEPKLLPDEDKISSLQQNTADTCTALKVVFPNDITPDSFHDVTVSHIESPSYLFCQFSLYMSKHLGLLMNSIQDYYTSTSGSSQSCLSSASCRTGMFVAAQYSADDLWYRAVVTTVQKSDAEVCFVDYGNSELVPFSRLKQLNPEFAKLPAQATPCCLVEIAPTSGTDWSEEVVERLFELVDGKSLVAQVKGHSDLSRMPFSFREDKQKLEIALIDSSIGIESELVNRGLAIHVSPASSPVPARAAVVQQVGSSTKTGLSFPTFSAGQICEMCVSYIESPSSFWIQMSSADNDLSVFSESLAAYYTSDRAKPLSVTNSSVGSICCAKYSEDGSWCRGVVKSINSEEEVEVCFIDYGNTDLMAPSEVKVLEAEFQALPVQAVECKLHNCCPLPSAAESWSDNAIGFFSHLVLDTSGPLSVKFVGQVDNVWEVEVYEGGEDVTDKLFHAGLAAPLESEVSETSPEVTLPVVIPVVELQPGHTYPVYIAFNDAPNKFYCQLVSDSDRLESLMAEVADFYNGNHLEPLIEAGAYCVAQYSGNSAWYRAKILSTDPKREVEVHFIDYGNSEHVSPNQILALESRFAALPAQAFCCSLIQNVNEVQFSSSVLDAFFSIDLNQEFRIKVTGSLGERHLVDLFDQSGFLINDSIIDMCDELLVSEPPPPLPVPVPRSQPVTSVASVEPTEELSTERERQVFALLKYRVGQTVDVYISNVDSPTNFYCQPLALTADLDNMMTELGAFVSKTPQLKLDAASLTPGQVCIARYSVDNEWYRAMVEGEVDGGILVTFVDYGNCEVTTNDSIAQIPPHILSVSVQAIQCSVFDGLGAEMEWSAEQVSQFQSLIPESDHLTLKICGVSSSGQYYIEISSNGDKMEFSSLLEQQIDHVSAAQLLHKDSDRGGGGGDHSFRPIPCDEEDHLVEHPDFVRPSKTAAKEAKTESESESDTGSEGKPLIKAPFKLSLAVSEEMVDVSVVYVQSPSLLYVQRVDCQSELTALSDEIEQYCSSFGDVQQEFPQAFHSGDFVLAKFADDGVWYRAEVIGVDSDGTAKVTFIDYGNEEVISPKDLMMCPENFLELPTQAIQCSLAKVPRRESWPSSYKELIDDLVTDKVLKATVQVPAGEGMISTIKLEDIEEGVDIVQMVLAKLQDECEMSSSDIITEEPEGEVPEDALSDDIAESQLPLIIPAQDLQPGTTHEVYVVSCSSPQSFVCQLASASEALDSITANLAKLYTGPGAGGQYALKATPRKGEFIVALFSQDGQWYRAIVTNVCEDGQTCDVLFVDYGNSETVAMENLRILDPILATHSSLSFECFLSGIEIPSDGGGEEKAAEEIMEIIGEDSCTAEVVTVGDSGRLGVALTTSTTGKNVGSLLIEAELVSTLAPRSSNFETEGGFIEAVESDKPPKTELQQPVIGQSSTTQDGRETLPDDVSHRVCLPERQGLQPATTHEVYIVSCTSPLSFTCQLASDLDALDSITTQLAKLYSREGAGSSQSYSLKTMPKEGDFVVALFSQDEQWYRATITECSDDGQSCEVVFVDYGNLENVPLENVRTPDPSLATHPPQVFECFLNGIGQLSSDDEDDDLEQRAAQKMTEVIGDDSCTIEIMTVDDTGRLGVALTTLVDEIDVGSLLVEAGLVSALTPASSSLEAVQSDITTVKDEHHKPEEAQDSATADGDTPKVVLQPEVLTGDNDVLQPEVPTPDNDAPEIELQEPQVKGLSTQLLEHRVVSLPERQELQPATTHKVYIVSCTSPLSFTCQLASDSDALDSITTQLAELYSTEGAGNQSYSTPREGDFVVALFSQDEQWYRALVTKVCDNAKSCHVRFVDYGNSETVPMENLRAPDPCLVAHPPLAFQCFLSGIEAPSDGESEFKQDAADQLTELIGKEACTVEILTVDSSGHLGVVLTTSSGVNVGSSLIAANLASPLMPTPSTLQSGGDSLVHSAGDETPATVDHQGPCTADHQTSVSRVPVAEDAEEPLPSPSDNEANNVSPEIATSFPKLTLEKGTRYSAEVVSVATLDDFVCRIVTREQQLHDLMEDIGCQGYRVGQEDALTINMPKKGLPVAACFSKDNQWYRAEIVSLGREPNTVSVLYVDRGNMETLLLERVKHLEKRFADALPTLCVTCGLPTLCENDLNPPCFEGEPWELMWPISSIKQFSQLTNMKTQEGSELYLEVIDVGSTCYLVKVIRSSLANGEEVDVRNALVENLREPKQIQFDDQDAVNYEEDPLADSEVLKTLESTTQQPTECVYSVATGDETISLRARTPTPQPGEQEESREGRHQYLENEHNLDKDDDDDVQKSLEKPAVKLEPQVSSGSEDDVWSDAAQDLKSTELPTSEVLSDAVVPTVPIAESELAPPKTSDGVVDGSDSISATESVNGNGTRGDEKPRVSLDLSTSGMSMYRNVIVFFRDK